MSIWCKGFDVTALCSHARLRDALIILKGLVVVQLVEVPLVLLFTLQHGQQALQKWVSELKKVVAVVLAML